MKVRERFSLLTVMYMGLVSECGYAITAITFAPAAKPCRSSSVHAAADENKTDRGNSRGLSPSFSLSSAQKRVPKVG